MGKINHVMIKSSLNIEDYHNYENYKHSYTSNKNWVAELILQVFMKLI